MWHEENPKRKQWLIWKDVDFISAIKSLQSHQWSTNPIEMWKSHNSFCKSRSSLPWSSLIQPQPQWSYNVQNVFYENCHHEKNSNLWKSTNRKIKNYLFSLLCMWRKCFDFRFFKGWLIEWVIIAFRGDEWIVPFTILPIQMHLAYCIWVVQVWGDRTHSYFRRKRKRNTKHPFLRSHISDLMNFWVL
jgi:hypothetical protein